MQPPRPLLFWNDDMTISWNSVQYNAKKSLPVKVRDADIISTTFPKKKLLNWTLKIRPWTDCQLTWRKQLFVFVKENSPEKRTEQNNDDATAEVHENECCAIKATHTIEVQYSYCTRHL